MVNDDSDFFGLFQSLYFEKTSFSVCCWNSMDRTNDDGDITIVFSFWFYSSTFSLSGSLWGGDTKGKTIFALSFLAPPRPAVCLCCLGAQRFRSLSPLFPLYLSLACWLNDFSAYHINDRQNRRLTDSWAEGHNNHDNGDEEDLAMWSLSSSSSSVTVRTSKIKWFRATRRNCTNIHTQQWSKR